MQQQRLSDLKKTLQRELKVQALPNDEVSSGLTPSNSARDLPSLAMTNSDGITNNGRTSSSKYESGDGAVSNTLVVPSNTKSKSPDSRGLHGVHSAGSGSLDFGSPLNSDMVGGGYSSHSRGQFNSSDGKDYHHHHRNHHHSKAGKLRLSSDEELDYSKDVNFEYLRHVILKFMLSRENEVSIELAGSN